MLEGSAVRQCGPLLLWSVLYGLASLHRCTMRDARRIRVALGDVLLLNRTDHAVACRGSSESVDLLVWRGDAGGDVGAASG